MNDFLKVFREDFSPILRHNLFSGLHINIYCLYSNVKSEVKHRHMSSQVSNLGIPFFLLRFN